MLTFEEAWAFTDTIEGTFSKVNFEQLWQYASCVPHAGIVVEVGVDHGRSASILLQAAEITKATVFLIDSWEGELLHNRDKVDAMRKLFAVDSMTMRWYSDEASGEFADQSIDLIHIDAGHYDHYPTGGPTRDCELWLPKLKSGGVACFHDVQSCFPDVDKAVAKYLADWESLGVWDGLGIWRKP